MQVIAKLLQCTSKVPVITGDDTTSHDKNAALQLVGVPTATRHGCGARPFASFSGSADSCTQTKKEAPMKLPFVDFFMQLNASNSQLVSSTTY